MNRKGVDFAVTSTTGVPQYSLSWDGSFLGNITQERFGNENGMYLRYKSAIGDTFGYTKIGIKNIECRLDLVSDVMKGIFGLPQIDFHTADITELIDNTEMGINRRFLIQKIDDNLVNMSLKDFITLVGMPRILECDDLLFQIRKTIIFQWMFRTLSSIYKIEENIDVQIPVYLHSQLNSGNKIIGFKPSTTPPDLSFVNVTSRCKEEFDATKQQDITKTTLRIWFNDDVNIFTNTMKSMLSDLSGRELFRRKIERLMNSFFSDFKNDFTVWIEAVCDNVYPIR
jgi:hypothetical protein